MTTEDLLNYYYRSDTIVFDGRKPALVFNPAHLMGAKVTSDVRDPKSNDLIVKEGKKFTRPVLRQMEQAKVKQVPIVWEEILGRIAAHDIVNPQTKEVIVESNHPITQEKLDLIREKGIHQIEVLFIDESTVGPAKYVVAGSNQLTSRCNFGDLSPPKAG
jgi:DNA-directed RNA polymerase subunit beta